MLGSRKVLRASACAVAAVVLVGLSGPSATASPSPSPIAHRAVQGSGGKATGSVAMSPSVHSTSHVHRAPIFGQRSPDAAAGSLVQPNVATGDGSNLSYQGGRVLSRPTVYIVFWSPAGKTIGSTYKALLPRFVSDVGATALSAVTQQYPDFAGPPGSGLSLGGVWTDTAAYPNSRGTAANPLLDSDIQQEMFAASSRNPSWTPPGHSAIYVIATARGVKSCMDATKTSCSFAGVGVAGANNYCGYHGVTASGLGGLYVNLPDSNNASSTGCSLANHGLTAPNNGEADWQISVASHEIFETMTDPDVNVTGAAGAWTNDQGFEIGDLCNNDFPSVVNRANLVVNRHRYVVQSEWSNATATCSLTYRASQDGHALRAGFNQNTVNGNDDGSAPAVDLGFSPQLGNTVYSQVYPNNNGNLTFDGPLGQFTPSDLSSSTSPIIAPFFADVDTRPVQTPWVTYGTGVVDGHLAFGATWGGVGYYNSKLDKLNRFQVVMVDRSDIAPGDVDVEFNYDQILWETGDASSGLRGLGGVPAVAGVGLGGGAGAVQLPGSAQSGAFEDWGTNPLVAGAPGGLPGRWLTAIRGGLFFV